MEGKTSLHKDLKLIRHEQREQREKRREAKELELQRLQALQEERERKMAELELLKEAQRQAQVLLEQDELHRRQQHEQLQQALEIQLKEAEEVCMSVCLSINLWFVHLFIFKIKLCHVIVQLHRLTFKCKLQFLHPVCYLNLNAV